MDAAANVNIYDAYMRRITNYKHKNQMLKSTTINGVLNQSRLNKILGPANLTAYGLEYLYLNICLYILLHLITQPPNFDSSQ